MRIRIRDEGPLVAGDLKQRVGPKGAWWDWDDGKIALEYLFFAGEVAAIRRPNDFARTYDLAHRVIPADILALPTPSEIEARKELLVRAARHHGIATFEDLTDYHRQRNPPCRPLIGELVEEGRLIETSVEGWSKPAYLHPDAVMPRRVSARALLSPFDPLVWNRDRTERLFGFRYRIEIYVPAPERQYGYYVLPFLLGDELVARVDLKADRATGRLLVQSAFGEPGIDEAYVAAELAAELEAMAGWLGLDRGVEVMPRGDLADALTLRCWRQAAPRRLNSPPSMSAKVTVYSPRRGSSRPWRSTDRARSTESVMSTPVAGSNVPTYSPGSESLGNDGHDRAALGGVAVDGDDHFAALGEDDLVV